MGTQIERIVWGESEDEQFEFVTVTEDLFDQVLAIMRSELKQDGFLNTTQEEAVKEEINMDRIFLSEGASICAIEKKTGVVASVQINKVQLKPKPNEKGYFAQYLETNCTNDIFGAKLYFLDLVDSKIDIFDHYNANCILELVELVTKNEYRRRGLAQGVTKYSIALAEAQAKGELILPKYPTQKIQALSVIYTVTSSQRIGIKFGFEVLYEGMNEFTYKNVTHKPTEDDQQTHTLCGKKILQ